MGDVRSGIAGHPDVQTLRTNFADGAPPTNTALVTVSAGTQIVVTGVAVACDDNNSVPVNVLIGFGATTTPTGAGVVFAHPGIRPGDYVADQGGVVVAAPAVEDSSPRPGLNGSGKKGARPGKSRPENQGCWKCSCPLVGKYLTPKTTGEAQLWTVGVPPSETHDARGLPSKPVK